MIYTIENDVIRLSVNSLGGGMCSLFYKPAGEERLHQSDQWWKGQDVVIFPIIGHAGPYVAKGEKYQLKPHGLVRYSELAVKETGPDFITFCYRSDAETLKLYPYEFEFEVGYRLHGNGVEVSYFIKSLSEVMPFYVGGHPAVYAPGAEAIIEFEEEQSPIVYPVCNCSAYPAGKMKSFKVDRQLMKEHKTYQLGCLSGCALSATTTDGYKYTYQSDSPVYAFWSNEEGGDYLCVEPWWGISDLGAADELSLRPFVNFERGKGSRFSFTMSVEKL